MRKSQVLVVAVALLFCSAVAVQAQGIYEVVGVPTTAREGGGAEVAGNVVLFLRTGDAGKGVVTVEYSAALAKGTSPMVKKGTGTASADPITTNLNDNTVAVNLEHADLTAGTSTVYTISNVRVDVRDATVPVAATVSGDGVAIVAGVVEVISGIEAALAVETTMASILTRGGVGEKMAVATISEGFRSAWQDGSQVLLRVSGVPMGATWGVWHVQTMDGGALAAAAVAGNVTVQIGTAGTPAAVVTAGAIVAPNSALIAQTGTGDDIDLTITFATPGAAGESLALEFGLDTLNMAVAEGMVTVMATMTPDEAGDDAEFFDEMFTAAATVFTYDPASCTLLFPYGTVLSDLGWNTGIAVSNPSGFGSSPLSGGITFTLFMNGAEKPMVVTTDAMTPGALDDEGMLEAGNTYTVLLSELLAMAGHDGDFIGHLFAKADFTGCRGVGWVTDFGTVNQAYLPYFGDNLDQGGVPANQ